MPNFVVVSHEAFSDKRWLRNPNYAFASKVAVCPVLGVEVATAAVALPMAFSSVGSDLEMIAVLGLLPDHNHFVASDGRWLGEYVPAALRCYPFQAGTTPDDQPVLCFDSDSGLLRDAKLEEGEAFFNADGTLSDAVQSVVRFLTELGNSRKATAIACAALQDCGVIVPWEVELERDGSKQTIAGLSKVDEGALNALTDDKFLELRKTGALLLAHCQMLSMQRMSLLGRLAQMQARAAAQSQAIRQMTMSGDIDLSSLTGGPH
jgi:hypothetical protein